MRIAIAAYVCDLTKGSEAGNSFRLIQQLDRDERLTICVVTRSSNAHNLQQQFSQEGCNVEIVGISDLCLFSYLGGVLKVYGQYMCWIRRARRELRERPYDIGHHLTWGSAYLGTPLVSRRKPFVFGPVGGGPPFWAGVLAWTKPKAVVVELMRSSIRRASWLLPTARQVQLASALLAANQTVVDETRRLGASAVHKVLPEAVPSVVEVDQQAHQQVADRFVWVGRFLPRKAPMLAIMAFEACRGDLSSDGVLELYGDGPLLEEARRYVDSRGLSRSIVFNGNVKNEDLLLSIRGATALIFTSIRDTTGAQVLEAASQGVPAIMASWQPMVEWVPASARWTVPRAVLSKQHITSFTSALLAASSASPAEWQSKSDAAKQWAMRHTWNEQGRTVTDIYSSLMLLQE